MFKDQIYIHCVKKKKKKNFTCFGQSTRLITCSKAQVSLHSIINLSETVCQNPPGQKPRGSPLSIVIHVKQAHMPPRNLIITCIIMPCKRRSTASLDTTIQGTKSPHNITKSLSLRSHQRTQCPIDHANPRLVQHLRRVDGHRSALRTRLPGKRRHCCPSCLSCSCHNFVGLPPSTLADNWAIPIPQGRPPEERLVAPGLQTLKVCGQALALLHLLRSEVLIKADAGSSKPTGRLERCMFGTN